MKKKYTFEISFELGSKNYTPEKAYFPQTIKDVFKDTVFFGRDKQGDTEHLSPKNIKIKRINTKESQ